MNLALDRWFTKAGEQSSQ